MIFCGDIALPFQEVVEKLRFPESLKKEIWIGNLEGSLCLDNGLNNMLRQNKVFNSMDAVRALCQQLNVKCFGIANNHLLDVSPAEYTVWNLHTIGIKHVGGGANIKVARKPVELEDFVVVAFGWENISCVCATDIEGGGKFI